jgi:hypothetical protein
MDPIGDFNNDGFDDFSYIYRAAYDGVSLSRAAIITGGSMTELVIRQFVQDDGANISPIGDPNSDGYDDFILTFGHVLPNNDYYYNNTVFFGSEAGVPADTLLLYIGHDINVYRTIGLGDINGDGYEDFTGRIYWPNNYVWFGNENLTAQYDLIINPAWSGNNNNGRGLIYGDLNNDGYDDVIGSMPVSYGDYGAFKVWLGGANMNGTDDLTIVGQDAGMLFGTGMAAGDFNADGYCDVAASAPHMSSGPTFYGSVYIFLGNSELADTTVGNEDEVLPESSGLWSVMLSPNPLMGRQDYLTLKLSGQGYKDLSRAEVMLSNIKGQVIHSVALTVAELQAGSVSLTPGTLPSGLYLLSVRQGNTLLGTAKLSVIR